MRSIRICSLAFLMVVLFAAAAEKSNAQVVYYTSRPVVVSRPVVIGPGYGHYHPTYSYYGGWYPGSYQNMYGNYGSYHVMQPYWTGGYTYRYW